MIPLHYGTPIKIYNGIKVKRDDLASSPPAPALGKLRGIALQVLATKAETVGVVDRSPTSRNSWAYAYCCKLLGKKCIAYGTEIREYQKEAISLGARYQLMSTFIGKPPEVTYSNARRIFLDEFPMGFIPLDDCHSRELVADAEAETLRTGQAMACDNLVIPTGSGGLAAGILKGMERLELIPNQVILHIGGSRRNPGYFRSTLIRLGVHPCYVSSLEVISESLELKKAPFPANPIYEAKAWAWLEANPLEGTTLFWNAGA